MNPLDTAELIDARDRLWKDEVVAVPTETVYGLAASIASEVGLRKIFSLKERPFFDPLIVHVASFRQAQDLVSDWPPLADFLARKFWPGPLTLVLPKADHVNSLITSGLETVALRYPAHPLMQDLIQMVGEPLAAPSANKFGHTSPSTAAHVRAEFPGTSLLVIDGGDCEVGVESTVIDFQGDLVRVLRPGAITEEMLRDALKRQSRPVEVVRAASEASPGHTKHHYQPSKPLVIAPAHLSHESLRERAATVLKLELTKENFAELELSVEPEQAARELYAEMRRVSETASVKALFVYARTFENGGLWSAIWDRLTRAASLDLR